MSEKKKDDKNRWRNKSVGFRCSPEEGIEIDKRWRLCVFLTSRITYWNVCFITMWWQGESNDACQYEKGTERNIGRAKKNQ